MSSEEKRCPTCGVPVHVFRLWKASISEVERLSAQVKTLTRSSSPLTHLIEAANRAEAEVERLREALVDIASSGPGHPYDVYSARRVAHAALHPDEKEEE